MNKPNAILIKAAGRILKPLARVLLRNGVACGAIEELIRQVYVDVAFERALREHRKATVSSVSAETGLSRKEVKRLREIEGTAEPAEHKYNRAIRVISGWLNDPRYSVNGKPRPLPLNDEVGSPGFADLVKHYSGDIPVRAMLDLLLAAGSVDKNGDTVNLIKHAYVPGSDPEEIIRILGKDTAELIGTIDHNLVCDADSRWFQRKVSNAFVDKRAIEEFRNFARDRSQQLLEELDNWLAQNEAPRAEDGCYVSLGIYYYQDPEQEEN
jgi:hypothetical protein